MHMWTDGFGKCTMVLGYFKTRLLPSLPTVRHDVSTVLGTVHTYPLEMYRDKLHKFLQQPGD